MDDHSSAEPSDVVTLAFPFLAIRIERDGDDLLVVASDGETAVFAPGLGGTVNVLIDRASGVAEVFTRYVEMLRVRCGDKRPLVTPDDEPVEPPVNLWQGIR